MKGDANDPPECKTAKSFSYGGYHECVLVDCYTEGTNYWPLDMPGGGGRTVTDLAGCQARCAKTLGCAHFSWWNDWGCHLQDGSATMNKNQPAATSGPRSCNKTLWQSREANVSEFAAGCCRYDSPLKEKYHGDQFTWMCRQQCDEDSTCLAAGLSGIDKKSPGIGECYTFHGEGVNFRTECNTDSHSDVCYWKKPVQYNNTMQFMRHITVYAQEHKEETDCVGGGCYSARAWTNGEPVYLPGKSIEECVADCAKDDDCFGANIASSGTCRKLVHRLHDIKQLKDATPGWYFQKCSLIDRLRNRNGCMGY